MLDFIADSGISDSKSISKAIGLKPFVTFCASDNVPGLKVGLVKAVGGYVVHGVDHLGHGAGAAKQAAERVEHKGCFLCAELTVGLTGERAHKHGTPSERVRKAHLLGLKLGQ